jgi:putative molybdopterin biosynthesis protein
MVARAQHEHISLQTAWNLLKKEFAPFCSSSRQVVPISSVTELLGRRLASDVIAERNVPHFNASAVDGYALDSKCTSEATAATPVFLEKDAFRWVNTGLAVDHCFDSVLMVEDSSVNEDEDRLTILKALSAGENIRPVGEDVARGQIIGREGEKINPPFLSLALAAGLHELEIFSFPRAIYIPTGDEIVPQEEWMLRSDQKAGRVPETNSTMIKGYFLEWGFPIQVGAVLPDDPDIIRKEIKKAAGEFDLVLVGAGSAKGRKDHIASIISEEGQLIFHWMLMKPGRPAMGGIIDGTPVLDLPGFPMSTAVVLWSIVYPLLQLFVNGDFDNEVLQKALSAVASEKMELLTFHSSPPGISEWLRFKAVDIDGQKKVIPLTSGSSTMWSMSETDGLALLPSKQLECPKGTSINVWITKHIPWEKRVLYQGSNDPALDRIATYVRRNGGDIILRSVGSMGGLAALSRGECHLAAAHLLDPDSGIYNDSFIESFSAGESWERRVLYRRLQGIIVLKGNPKSITSVSDLSRPDVRLVNRQPGAGTRVLLDMLLKEEGISHTSVSGYENQSVSHYDAANRICAGVADVAIGIKAAADSMGLDFIPITEEPFEIVYPSRYKDHPGIAAFVRSLDDPDWRRSVEQLGGYMWVL